MTGSRNKPARRESLLDRSLSEVSVVSHHQYFLRERRRRSPSSATSVMSDITPPQARRTKKSGAGVLMGTKTKVKPQKGVSSFVPVEDDKRGGAASLENETSNSRKNFAASIHINMKTKRNSTSEDSIMEIDSDESSVSVITNNKPKSTALKESISAKVPNSTPKILNENALATGTFGRSLSPFGFEKMLGQTVPIKTKASPRRNRTQNRPLNERHQKLTTRRDFVDDSVRQSAITNGRKFGTLKRLKGNQKYVPANQHPNRTKSRLPEVNTDRGNLNDPNSWALVPFSPLENRQSPAPINMDNDDNGCGTHRIRQAFEQVPIIPNGPVRLESGVPVFTGECKIFSRPQIVPERNVHILRVRVSGELKFLHVYTDQLCSVEFDHNLVLTETEDILGRHPDSLYGTPVIISGEAYCFVKFKGCDYLEMVAADQFFEEFPELQKNELSNRRRISFVGHEDSEPTAPNVDNPVPAPTSSVFRKLSNCTIV